MGKTPLKHCTIAAPGQPFQGFAGCKLRIHLPTPTRSSERRPALRSRNASVRQMRRPVKLEAEAERSNGCSNDSILAPAVDGHTAALAPRAPTPQAIAARPLCAQNDLDEVGSKVGRPSSWVELKLEPSVVLCASFQMRRRPPAAKRKRISCRKRVPRCPHAPQPSARGLAIRRTFRGLVLEGGRSNFPSSVAPSKSCLLSF